MPLQQFLSSSVYEKNQRKLWNQTQVPSSMMPVSGFAAATCSLSCSVTVLFSLCVNNVLTALVYDHLTLLSVRFWWVKILHPPVSAFSTLYCWCSSSGVLSCALPGVHRPGSRRRRRAGVRWSSACCGSGVSLVSHAECFWFPVLRQLPWRGRFLPNPFLDMRGLILWDRATSRGSIQFPSVWPSTRI